MSGAVNPPIPPPCSEEEIKQLFASLQDVRDKYPRSEGEQNYELVNTIPALFRGVGKESASCLDATVVLLCHLYHVVALRYRGRKLEVADAEASATSAKVEEVMRQEEEKHPLLRFIWTTLEGLSPDAKTAQMKLRFEIRRKMPQNADIEQFLEHESMYATLWQRTPFLLFDDTMLWKPSDQPGWNMGPCRDVLAIARRSLIRWNGEQDLAPYISHLCNITYHDRAQSMDFRFFFNHPAVIRVHYAHEAPRQPWTYEELRTVPLEVDLLQGKKSDTPLTDEQPEQCQVHQVRVLSSLLLH
ncbi:hypothetical protein F4780DRAFT_794519 [Xylariomycetidae sp. FL0641]|nr:hypothetical protein F4780DRAFT_794519 [Xylariomycetidae sp. FL0641]